MKDPNCDSVNQGLNLTHRSFSWSNRETSVNSAHPKFFGSLYWLSSAPNWSLVLLTEEVDSRGCGLSHLNRKSPTFAVPPSQKNVFLRQLLQVNVSHNERHCTDLHILTTAWFLELLENWSDTTKRTCFSWVGIFPTSVLLEHPLKDVTSREVY